MYQSINEDLKDLIETINDTGITPPTQKMFDILFLIREIFIGRKKATEEKNHIMKNFNIDQDDLGESVIKTISKLNDKEEPPKDAKFDMPPLQTEEDVEKRQKGHGLKIMTPSQLITRLLILLAQKQAGNNSQKHKNETRQIIYSLYRSKNLSKTLYKHLINSI